jgi:hypothetical protein
VRPYLAGGRARLDGSLTADEDEPVEVVIYCPECDEREFGGRNRA